MPQLLPPPLLPPNNVDHVVNVASAIPRTNNANIVSGVGMGEGLRTVGYQNICCVNATVRKDEPICPGARY